MTLRILVVCGGNTCRSVMAQAIAQTIWPEAEVVSAGLDPGEAVQPHAISVARMMSNQDVSGHQPTALEKVDLQSFDAVIVLDSTVARTIRRAFGPSLTSRLYERHVPDPFGLPLADYVNVANTIQSDLARLSSEGLAEASLEGVTELHPSSADAHPLVQLRRNIDRWIKSYELAVPTHLQGIGARASTSYEECLKRTISLWIELAAADLDSLLRESHYKGNARNLEKLTQGSLIEVLVALSRSDREFAHVYVPALDSALRRVVEARNKIAHTSSADLTEQVDSLLRALQEVLSFDRFWNPVFAASREVQVPPRLT